jgi:hypoxanthine phosphoribosyltransferase
MANKKENISWRAVETLCNSICNDITKDGIEIENIIGISRGGLIPATLCAKRLNVRRVYSVGLMSYSDGDDYESRKPAPVIYQSEPMSTHFIKNTLIVDDISDKGNTLGFITTGMLTSPTFFNEDRLFTATLYKKKNTYYHPDYYGTIATDGQWMVFPWEQ